MRSHPRRTSTGALWIILAFAAGCASSGGQPEKQTPTSTGSPVTTVAASEPAPAPPEGEADVSLDFSLVARDDEYTPWLLTVVATSNTDKAAVDHDDRILQRWDGDDWEAIAVVPFDLMTPGQLVACDLDGPCDRPAVDEPLPPRRTGRERVFRVRPLEDGTYRMAELNDRDYTVESNHITIEGAAIRE